MRQEMNSFQPVGFSLAVVPIDDIDAFAPMDLTCQVSKVMGPDRSKEHIRNSNIASFFAVAALDREGAFLKQNERQDIPALVITDGSSSTWFLSFLQPHRHDDVPVVMFVVGDWS